MRFKYTVLTRTGRTVHGITEAPSEKVAEEALWRAGYTIASLEAERAALSVREVLPSLFAVTKRDLIILSRQMATLLSSGVAILPALQLMADQVGNSTLRLALLDVVDDIQAGASFSDALSKHPTVFPLVYHRMVQVGERTGRLELILRQVSVYLEKEEAITRRVQSAMVYPAVILLLAVGVVILLVTVALPAMMGLFVELKVELPWTTRLLLAVTNFARDYGTVTFLAVLALVAVLAVYIQMPAGRAQWHLVLLRIPVIGGVNLKGALARMSRTMAILLRAGLPLAEVMELVMQTSGNVVVAQALGGVRDELLAGRGLSAPLSRQKFFPRLLVQMVRVGEETGTLDGNLETLADFYEEETDRAISTMTSLIEPAMLLFAGGVVAFIAVSVIMPMYSIMGSVK
jgi:type IV pilus assembly protein PilC